MATFGTTVRRGLPRRPGGEPWPPAGEAPAPVVVPVVETTAVAVAVAEAVAATPALAGTPVVASEAATRPRATPESGPATIGATAAGRSARRGLPRVAGGEPWPPASAAPVVAAATGSAAAAAAAGAVERDSLLPTPQETVAPLQDAVAVAPRASIAVSGSGEQVTVRRGLPRVPGGEPWPAADFAAAPATPAPSATPAAPATRPTPAAPAAPVAPAAPATPSTPATPAAPAQGTLVVASGPATRPESSPEPRRAEVVRRSGPRPPLPFTKTVWPGAATRSRPEALAAPEATGIRSLLKRPPWTLAIAGIFAALGLLLLAACAVLLVRWLLSLNAMQDFLTTYPGQSPLPEGAPVGIPGWLAWQHFFNTFFMVLIIRTGLQVRNDKRPGAFWTPRWSKNGRGKISLSLWFHQSLDVIWLTNGVIFVVLLFTTGQWMRVVPTSWDVVPNAISAALRYVSLDWPTENGWVNYNSLQVLAYFVTIFVAAPLAAITGVRMSGLWPKNATRLSKAYPIEWARAIHFPVMLYFVLFIIVHVTLVLATGALRNLNHMYGGQDAVNWTGFWIFIGSLVLIAAAWVAARPLVLAPIARLSGKVSQR